MLNMICVTGAYLSEIIKPLISQVSRHFKNFIIVIFFVDSINVISVKFCMMVLFFELYLFIPFSVTLTLFQSHTIVEKF